MKYRVDLVLMLAAAASLAGCETTGGDSRSQSGISATRFHLGQPIARGEIRVEPADPARANSVEFAQQAASVERELGRLGWIVNPANARSEQVALIHIDQGSREALRQRSTLNIGLGGGVSGRSGTGVGVGATVPLGSRGPREVVATELSVRIQRRSDATVAWEGRAQLEARATSPLANSVTAVDRLVEALFRDFPGESGRTIRLR